MGAFAALKYTLSKRKLAKLAAGAPDHIA